MPQPDEILVVTATLGRSAFLEKSVASVAGCGGASFCIVTPGGEVSGLGVRFPNASVVAQETHGFYPALNAGFRSSGPWQLGTYLNDDDLLDADGLRAAVAAFADPGVDVVFGKVGLIGGDGLRIGALPVARNGKDLLDLLARGIMPLAQPGTLFRREVWAELGGFDESYRSAGDLDFFVRALLRGKRFHFVNAHVADFRLHAGQISKDESLAATEKARALAPLAGRRGSMAALMRFRIGNLGVYLGRLLRHGPASMKTLYRTTK